MELYSYSKYKGYNIFVEVSELDEDHHYDFIYEGVAQFNGTTIHSASSLISGDCAELFLKEKIDEEDEKVYRRTKEVNRIHSMIEKLQGIGAKNLTPEQVVVLENILEGGND